MKNNLKKKFILELGRTCILVMQGCLEPVGGAAAGTEIEERNDMIMKSNEKSGYIYITAKANWEPFY